MRGVSHPCHSTLFLRWNPVQPSGVIAKVFLFDTGGFFRKQDSLWPDDCITIEKSARIQPVIRNHMRHVVLKHRRGRTTTGGLDGSLHARTHAHARAHAQSD